MRSATAVAVAVMASLVACTSASDPSTVTGSSVTSSACQPVEAQVVQAASAHLIGDAEPPAPFTSVPATSGWHTTAVPPPGRSAEPLRDAAIVSALEQGIVVLAVAPGELATTDPGLLDDLVAQFPQRLLVTPYPRAMPTPIALLTWGRLQRCTTVDPAVVTAFVLTERTLPDAH